MTTQCFIKDRAICILALLIMAASAHGIHAQDSLNRKHHDLALTIGYTDSNNVKTSFLNAGLIGGTRHLHGLQLNTMTSFASYDMKGLQISGLSGVAMNMRGIQLSALGNVSLSPFRGIQISGITNISRGVKSGIQLTALSNISSSYMRGLQIGSYNYADTLNGSQIGLVNICISQPRGVQIGIVNYSREARANKIGLVNITPDTKTDLMLFGGTSTKINAAFRFRNRSTYSIIGFGTHYMGLDEKFSGALYYRLGKYLKLSPRWSVSADAGIFHIETFQHNSEEKPERLYSLQARVNADYRFNDYTALFASVGYGDTRYYNHNRRYRKRMIFETGVTVAYNRKHMKEKSKEYTYDPLATDTATSWAWDNPANRIKHPWKAAVETFGINVFVNSFDRFVLNEDFAKISMHSIKKNIENGFVWDNDQFSTNLFAHPYHGGLYFNSARSNGLGFWESVPYSFGGSLMWELACETEPPAINDFIATSVGGVCIGEITHRISDLVYDDREYGMRRFMREAAGLLICPVRAFNRILSGDAWRVRHNYYKYHDHNRIPVNFSVTAGNRYLADEGGMFRGEHNPYIDLMLGYGDAFDNEGSKPYDYFTANITFGLSTNQPIISSVHLLGKLWGVNFYEGKEMIAVFGLFQHFNYYDSEPVKDGTSHVPYRISEAASFGPGLIYRFPQIGNLGSMEQRIFLDAILLGGSLSDHYKIIDRDYNMGSGFSAKIQTKLDFPKFGNFLINADFYKIYTWKGYEEKDMSSSDPLFTNAQGDKSNASLLVINPRLQIYLGKGWNLDLFTSYYMRETRYKFYENVRSNTFEARIGFSYQM